MWLLLLHLAGSSILRCAPRILTLVGALLVGTALAQDDAGQASELTGEQRYIAAFQVHTAAEFRRVLLRAEELLVSGIAPQDPSGSVTFILHGPEVNILLRQNYLANKDTVDLAASLSALGVVDIKACRTWMGGQGIRESDLQPFVATVPYGPGEERRLVQEENYLYF